jgi:hypothetical protein
LSTGLLDSKAPCCGMPELLASSTGLLETLAPCGGMSELLAPKKVTSLNIRGRLLTTGESLPPVVFSASLSWLILSVP